MVDEVLLDVYHLARHGAIHFTPDQLRRVLALSEGHRLDANQARLCRRILLELCSNEALVFATFATPEQGGPLPLGAVMSRMHLALARGAFGDVALEEVRLLRILALWQQAYQPEETTRRTASSISAFSSWVAALRSRNGTIKPPSRHRT